MDASGQYGKSGMDERLGTMLAIHEFNAKGGVLGRQIEALHMDTETTPATGSRVAERMITRDEAAFLIGAVHSGVANAISQVAQKYGTVFLNTNSSSPPSRAATATASSSCGTATAPTSTTRSVKNAVRVIGKSWLLLTNDYVWGHTTSERRALVEATGGEIVEELLVPQNTRDFSSYLLKVQQIKPDVVAAAVGGDDIKALRQQVVQTKLEAPTAWINNQQDWPDVYGLGPERCSACSARPGTTGSICPAWRSSSPRYQTTYPGVPIQVPGNVFLNGYMATRELLRVVEETGSTNNIAVIKELEGRKMSAVDRMQHHDAWIDPSTHQVQQTIYLATQRQAGRDKDDLFKILANGAARTAMDNDARSGLQARRTPTSDLRQCLRESGHRVDLLPHLVNGFALGLLFALLALGFMLIVGVMELINLAHGSLFALGAYFAWAIATPGLPLPLDLLRSMRCPSWAGAPPARRRVLVGLRRHPRSADAADLRQGRALRPAPHLRRGARDRGDDPRHLGLGREACSPVPPRLSGAS